MTGGPLRTVVCGTNFGRFYLSAVRDLPGFELVGVLARGGRYSRELAGRLGVPCYPGVDELPPDVDCACVIVPSAVAGGGGTELAKALLARGISVLQEHPVHPDEMAECLQLARRAGAQYQVNTHYARLEPVARFLAAAQRLRSRQEVLFVDAASAVHVLHPLVDVLGRALGGLRPWRHGPASDPGALPGPAPLRTLHAVLAGVPVTLRVHNQMHPTDRDNHALFWHRIAIGTEGGVLTLADTHGPVLWHPRLHSARDRDHRLLFSGTPALDLPTVSSVGQAPAHGPTFAEAFATLWPRAIAAALEGFAAAVHAGQDPLRHGQYDLAVARIWRDLAAELGPPELVEPPTPHPLPVAAIDPGDQDAAGDGYGGSAEFFDLAAREHARRSAPAAVAALSGIDPAAGPLLDIGAGTGLVTAAVARALPDLQVVAAEPSAPMRAILTSRVADDPALRARVTVVDADADTVAVPGSLAGVLLCGVLGHLDRDRRVALFRRLAAALAPGAPVVVELMGMRTATPMPDTRLFDTTLGTARYEWWMSGEPVGPDLMRLHTTWRVHQDGLPRREVRDSYLWHPFGIEELAAETGFDLERLPPPHDCSAPHMAVLRPPAPRAASPGDRDGLRAERDAVMAEADRLR